MFFTLRPDCVVREHLDRWAHTIHGRTGGRVMRTTDLHLTLAFLASVPSERLAALAARAGAVAFSPFMLTLDRVALFKRQRIAWAGARTVPRELEALSAALRIALDEGGFPYDPKPFVPHITLVRDATVADVPDLPPIAWHVDRLVLLRSGERAAGAGYTLHGEWLASSLAT